MSTLPLKSCQQAALDALQAFAHSAQLKGAALTFGEASGQPYDADPFGAVPCIGLRIPTGSGKTLMAVHAANMLAQEWRATDASVAVRLVPSDTIRSQTLKALQTAGHPCRASLPLFDLFDPSNEAVAKAKPAQEATYFIATVWPDKLPDTGASTTGCEVTQVAGDQNLVVTDPVHEALATLLVAQVRGAKKQAQIQAKVAQHNALVATQAALVSRGERFAPVPTLGYRSTPQGQLWAKKRIRKYVFRQAVKEKNGVGLAGQLDRLLG